MRFACLMYLFCFRKSFVPTPYCDFSYSYLPTLFLLSFACHRDRLLHQAPYQPQHRLPSLASYFIPLHRQTVILSLSHAQYGNQFVSQSHPQGVSNNGSAGRSSSLVLSEGSETPQPHRLVESGKGCAGRLGDIDTTSMLRFYAGLLWI
jgi:hypothetical protein